MALGGVRRQGPKLSPVEDVRPGDDVIHVDQLSDAKLAAFLQGLAGDGTLPSGIDVGDVVVFTEYYRVKAV